MATNKGSYVSLEIEYMEQKIELLKKAVDQILDNLEDRYGPREMPNGKIVKALISSREQQLKDATAVLEKLPKMIYALDELRGKEEAKNQVRAGADIPSRMQRDKDNKDGN